MLGKTRRITKERDFEHIFKKGWATKTDSLFLKASERKGETRFAVVVSKKVAQKATERNRLKRLLRQALRQNLPGIQEGQDVVVVALPRFHPENLSQTQELVRQALKKASLLI